MLNINYKSLAVHLIIVVVADRLYDFFDLGLLCSLYILYRESLLCAFSSYSVWI